MDIEGVHTPEQWQERTVAASRTNLDCTLDLHASQQQNHDSADSLRALFESAGIGMAEVDAATGRFVKVNAAYCAITHRSETQLLGMTTADLHHPDDASFDVNHFIRMTRGEETVFDAEKRYLLPDGSIAWVHVHAKPLCDATGRVVRMVAVIRNITQRKRAQEALRNSEERLRLATQTARIGVFDYDNAAKRTLWSPELCALFGVPLGAITAISDALPFVHPDDRTRFLDGVRIATDPRGDGELSDEFRIYRADTGEMRWLAKTCQTFFEGIENSRRAIRTIGVMVDITEQKRREGHDQFVNDLSGLWTTVRDLRTLVQITADATAQHLGGVNLVSLANITPDASITVVGLAHGYAKSVRTGPLVISDFLTESGRAQLISGGTLVINDVTTDPRTAFARKRYLANEARALIVVPLLNDKGVKSALHVSATGPRAWRADEVRLLERIAARLWPTVERVLAEEALRQSEERLDFLLKLSDTLRPLNDPIAIQDAAVQMLGKHLKVNRVIYSEIEGTDFFVRQAYEEGVAPVVRSGQVGAYGMALLDEYKRSDTVRVNDVRTDPRFTEDERANLLAYEIVSFLRAMLLRDGRWVAAFSLHSAVPRVWTSAEVALFRDVAERIWEAVEHAKTTVAWRSTEARFRAFLENSQTIAWLKDEDGRHVYISPTYEKRFGVRLEDRLGKTVFDVWPKEIAEQFTQVDRAVLANNRPLEALESVPNPDGSISWWLNNRFSFQDASGRRSIGGIGMDVTDRKLAEEALRNSDRRKNEFLATLAHELRNPLAALSLGLQLALGKSEIDTGLKGNLDMMDRQLAHLVHLVDDLLDVGRISAGKLELHVQPLSLLEVLTNGMDEVRRAIESRRHEVELRIKPGSHRVRGDSARLTQVIANLIENAAKYTEPGGRIRVSLSQENGFEVVCVEDTGIGIPADELPRVFDLFSQVRVHQGRSAEGLGIGLAIVHKLVELHGGSVSVTSSGLGCGSTFTVHLPVLEETTATPVSEDAARGAIKASRPCRVLIVDDNEDAAVALAKFLDQAGHQTQIAHDGLRAIEIAKTAAFDLVFMDLGMPGIDGIETAKRIRTLPGCERLRIAALTGWGQESDRARTQEAGFDWHLVKPINATLLTEFIARLGNAVP
jgi:PAS domain S-box-containing protein